MSDSLRPHSSPWNSPGQKTGVGNWSLLQGIFPTQGWNPGLPHCRWIIYQLSHKGSPRSHWWEPILIGWCLYKKRKRHLSYFSQGHEAEKPPRQHPDLRLPVFRPTRKNISIFLNHPTYGILLQQPNSRQPFCPQNI